MDGFVETAVLAVLHTEHVHALFLVAVSLSVDFGHHAQGIESNL